MMRPRCPRSHLKIDWKAIASDYTDEELRALPTSVRKHLEEKFGTITPCKGKLVLHEKEGLWKCPLCLHAEFLLLTSDMEKDVADKVATPKKKVADKVAAAKKLVGIHAAGLVTDGMRVGLGSGTTAAEFVKALGERVKAGLRVRCVASSDTTAALAMSVGIQVVALDTLDTRDTLDTLAANALGAPTGRRNLLDLYVDGADEMTRRGLALIKGGGGALLREKIVASAAEKFIVIADRSKVVDTLGRFPVPVEVVKMALPVVKPKLAALGLDPQQRLATDGKSPFITDEGHYILDCTPSAAISDPAKMAADIRAIVGVVEHGLFLNMATSALVADDTRVTEFLP